MPGSMNRRTIIGVWFGVLAAAAGAGALLGGSITLGTGALWLFACVAPPAVMLMVWRDPPPTIVEVMDTAGRQN
jgi:hypothetical protein